MFCSAIAIVKKSLSAYGAVRSPMQPPTLALGLSGWSHVRPWMKYGFAVIATVATLEIRLALDQSLGGQSSLVVFTLPIMLSAYLGGIGPGLLATGLAAVASCYYLLPPIHSFHVASEAERWQLFFVLLTGVVISALNEALHRSRQRVVEVNR